MIDRWPNPGATPLQIGAELLGIDSQDIDNQSFQCPIPDRPSYSNASDLKRHIDIHHGDNHTSAVTTDVLASSLKMASTASAA